METTHGREGHGPDEGAHQQPERGRRGEGRGNRMREDWFSDEYVAHWLNEQEGRAAERNRQFAMVRSMVPKEPDQPFRYLNVGAGPGNLDEVLLERFSEAEATLVDGSMAMLAEARKRLDRFEGRAEFVQANLAAREWTGAVTGPFDLAVSTIAIHNLRDPNRIRGLYAEICGLLGHGGLFVNLDYVRMARPTLRPLIAWAARDSEAGYLRAQGGGGQNPGTVEEQLGWLREAGFAVAECFWREFGAALLVGVRDHLHIPGADDGQGDRGH